MPDDPVLGRSPDLAGFVPERPRRRLGPRLPQPVRRQLPGRRLPANALLEPKSAEGQLGEVGSDVQTPPKVWLLDLGDPVSNVYVTFTIMPGPESEFPGGARTYTTLTDQNGQAVLPVWTIKEQGQHEVQVSAGSNVVSFIVEAYPRGPA